MSDNTNNQTTSTNSKSTKYIIIFSVVVIAAALILFIASRSKEDETTPSTGSNTPVQATAQAVQDVTKGSVDVTIEADISFRDIDFSLTKEEIIEKEKKMSDTLDDPSIAESSDGYAYITFKSNPEEPLSYNNISASTAGNPGLTYVINNGNLDEVRLQFGTLDSATSDALLASIRTQYGDSTFYRSTNGTETYWWKTTDKWLMLTKDSVGTTLFFRKN